MSISTTFMDSAGTTITGRSFSPGQSIQIKAHCIGLGSLPMAFVPCTLDIEGGSFTPIYDSMDTSIDGNATFHVTLPSVTSQANVVLSIVPLFGLGTDSVTIPIAIGNVTPKNENEGSPWETYLIWGGVIVVALVALGVLPKLISGTKASVAAVRAPAK